MMLAEERMNATVRQETVTVAEDWHKGLIDQIGRLQFAVQKLTKWSGVEVADLIDEGYLQEGDMD